MISYRFVPISSQKGVLFFETPGTCDLSNQQRQALLSVQTFTGNDYVSLFLRKGKQVCRKMVKPVHSD